jgi:hypothetical protein
MNDCAAFNCARAVIKIAKEEGISLSYSQGRNLIKFLEKLFKDNDDMSVLSLNSSCHSVNIEPCPEPIVSHPDIECWCCSFVNVFENAKCEMCNSDLILGFIPHKALEFRLKCLNG